MVWAMKRGLGIILWSMNGISQKKCFQNPRSDNQECDIWSETEKVYLCKYQKFYICHVYIEYWGENSDFSKKKEEKKEILQKYIQLEFGLNFLCIRSTIRYLLILFLFMYLLLNKHQRKSDYEMSYRKFRPITWNYNCRGLYVQLHFKYYNVTQNALKLRYITENMQENYHLDSVVAAILIGLFHFRQRNIIPRASREKS